MRAWKQISGFISIENDVISMWFLCLFHINIGNRNYKIVNNVVQISYLLLWIYSDRAPHQNKRYVLFIFPSLIFVFVKSNFNSCESPFPKRGNPIFSFLSFYCKKKVNIKKWIAISVCSGLVLIIVGVGSIIRRVCVPSITSSAVD